MPKPTVEIAAPDPIQVEWQVLFEEDPDPNGDGLPGDDALSPYSRAAWTRPWALGQWIALLSLFLLVVAYTFWDSAASRSQESSPHRQFPALSSADALAAQARETILTEHLRISAWGPDVAVVSARGEEMERLYAAVYAAVGLPLIYEAGAPDGRLLVAVEGVERLRWDKFAGRVVLPSPARMAESAPIRQADLLRQSWAVVLGERAVLEASAVHQIPYGWLPLLGGLRLWLLWDVGGPLAESRETIVEWLGRSPGSGLDGDEADAICRAFARWGLSPLDYSIPLGCGRPSPSPMPLPAELAALAPIYPPRDSLDDQFTPAHPQESKASAIALALLLDYATERYGRQSLPRLLAALAEHDGWDSLISAVYGVSAQEFEAGWQAWLP